MQPCCRYTSDSYYLIVRCWESRQVVRDVQWKAEIRQLKLGQLFTGQRDCIVGTQKEALLGEQQPY